MSSLRKLIADEINESDSMTTMVVQMMERHMIQFMDIMNEKGEKDD